MVTQESMRVALEGELALDEKMVEFDGLYPIEHIGFANPGTCRAYIGFLTRDLS